mgnify:CR=1 FL=1
MIALICLVSVFFAKIIPEIIYTSVYAKGEFLNVAISVIIVIYVYIYYFIRLYNDYYDGGKIKKAIKIDLSYLFLCFTILLGVRHYTTKCIVEQIAIRLIMYIVVTFIIKDLWVFVFKKECKLYSVKYTIILALRGLILVSLIIIARITNAFTIFKFYKLIVYSFVAEAILEYISYVKSKYWMHENSFNLILEFLAKTTLNGKELVEKAINDKNLNLEIKFLLGLSFIRRLELNNLTRKLYKYSKKNNPEQVISKKQQQEFRNYIYSNYMRRNLDMSFLPSVVTQKLQSREKDDKRRMEY